MNHFEKVCNWLNQREFSNWDADFLEGEVVHITPDMLTQNTEGNPGGAVKNYPTQKSLCVTYDTEREEYYIQICSLAYDTEVVYYPVSQYEYTMEMVLDSWESKALHWSAEEALNQQIAEKQMEEALAKFRSKG